MHPTERGAGAAEQWVSEAMPEGFDWQRMVRRYPVPALLVAAAGGFLLGSQRGSEMLRSLSEFAAEQLVDGINRGLGDKVL